MGNELCSKGKIEELVKLQSIYSQDVLGTHPVRLYFLFSPR